MSHTALLILVAPLLAQSLGGFTWLAWHLRRQGGQVRVGALSLPDLMTAAVLALALIQLAALNFAAQVPRAVPKSLNPRDILAEPLLLLLVGAAITGMLVARRVSLEEVFGWRRLPAWRALLWAAGLLALAWPSILALSQLVAHFVPKEASDEQVLVSLFRSEVREGHYAGIACIFIAAVFMAPVGEEFLFRGYFYPVGKRFFGAASSGLLTAVLFALIHVNVVSFAGLCLLALCLTLAYEYTGSLLVPIGMHAAFNAVNLAVIFAEAMRGAGP